MAKKKGTKKRKQSLGQRIGAAIPSLTTIASIGSLVVPAAPAKMGAAGGHFGGLVTHNAGIIGPGSVDGWEILPTYAKNLVSTLPKNHFVKATVALTIIKRLGFRKLGILTL